MRSLPLAALALVALAGCGVANPDDPTPDAGVETPDGGAPDSGDLDSGTPDAHSPDGGDPDGGDPDGGGPDGGDLPYQPTRMGANCTIESTVGVVFIISGVQGCDDWHWHEQVSSLRINVWDAMGDPQLQNLHAGGTVTIGDTGFDGANAVRWTFAGQNFSFAGVVGGSMYFETYVHHQSATGSYTVIYEDDTTEQGKFSAVWCSGEETPAECP